MGYQLTSFSHLEGVHEEVKGIQACVVEVKFRRALTVAPHSDFLLCHEYITAEARMPGGRVSEQKTPFPPSELEPH